MAKAQNKLSLLISAALLVTLIHTPEPAYAQWPPFDFSMKPSFEGGQITYHLGFSSQVDWAITDITFKVPLPDGTQGRPHLSGADLEQIAIVPGCLLALGCEATFG
jgi:hypothetical protein